MLFDWSLIIFGTATDPLKGNSHVSIPLTKPIATPPQDAIITPSQESDTRTPRSGKAIVY